MKTMNIAVFASGNGSNFDNIVNQQRAKNLNYEVKLLICDKEQAYAIKRAEKLNIDCITVPYKNFSNKEQYELHILEILKSYKIQFIVLAGYMRLIGNTLLDNYQNKIINIHPSLLPSFKGKNAIEQAFQYGVKVTGVTVHYVDSGMDTGNIIDQTTVNIKEGYILTDLEKEIHKAEYDIYPRVLDKLFHKGE